MRKQTHPQRRPHHQKQIDLFPVLQQPPIKLVRQRLAEEHYIRFNQRLPLPLVPPLILLFLPTLILPFLLVTLLNLLPRPFLLLPLFSRVFFCFGGEDFGSAEGAEGDAGGEDVLFDGGTGEAVMADEAGGGSEGACRAPVVEKAWSGAETSGVGGGVRWWKRSRRQRRET